MMDEYAGKQAARDREYEAAFSSEEVKEWIAGLSPEERMRLEKEGMLKPLIQKNHCVNMREEDLAESPLASAPSDIIDQIEPTLREDASAEVRSDVLAAFCARIRSATNPLLVFDAVCFATGVLALDGQSQTELAARHGVTRSAFSKIATQWVKTFGIKPSRGMKSTKARKTYSKLTRERWHERNHRKPRSTD